MKLRLFLIICLLASINTFAQDVPYAEKAAQLQKEIWGTGVPEFKSTTVPANLANESAVVLARAYNSQRISNGKIKYLIITAAITTKTLRTNTLHERVKINDKAALENYATLEYQKKLDRTVSVGLFKIANVHNTYIGVKIIKPDGKEVVMNTSEEVMIKNEAKDQKGKLAISDLEVGDIIDYYVSSVTLTEDTQNDSYKDNDDVFMLADEYPVLYYSIDFQFNKKLNVRYISANGAPAIQETKNKDGDILLSLKLRNLPKYQSQLWSSRLRQYPYVEIGSSFTSYANTADRKINKEISMLHGYKAQFQSAFGEYPDFDVAEKKLKDYFKNSKALKAAPLESVMKVLYNEWKYNVFCSYAGNELENFENMNYRRANSKYAAITMCMILTDLDVDHDVLMVSPRTSNTLENVFTMNDFEAMIRINSPTPMYMAFDDVFTHFNQIPAYFQGEKVIAMHPKRHNALKYSFTDQEALLPVSPVENNKVEEQLQVSLVSSDMQKLKIERVVKQSGTMRHEYQKTLIPVEDVDKGHMELVNGEPLTKRLSQVKATKKMSSDYLYTFAKEREQMNKNFLSELKGQYDQEAQQLTNMKIVNPALDRSSPVFEFSSAFVLNNLVKKAGNNYIVDAGKLAGTFIKLDDNDKKRNTDVYMPAPRSFKYTISLTVPEGYSAQGVEEMNQNKANKTGSFSSVAAVKGNVLTITINRVYSNNFEKASDWPMLLELLETASSFNDQKILLEKKG